MISLKQIFTHRVYRFLVVGVANAVISFGVLNFAYYSFNQTKIVASLIGTSCALILSFILNREFVFADKSRRIHQQMVPFVVVTISGSLIVLNLVYIIVLKLFLEGHETVIIDAIKTISGVELSRSFVDINLSTIIGAIAALIWNYNGYRIFVFKGVKIPAEVSDEETTT